MLRWPATVEVVAVDVDSAAAVAVDVAVVATLVAMLDLLVAAGGDC